MVYFVAGSRIVAAAEEVGSMQYEGKAGSGEECVFQHPSPSLPSTPGINKLSASLFNGTPLQEAPKRDTSGPRSENPIALSDRGERVPRNCESVGRALFAFFCGVSSARSILLLDVISIVYVLQLRTEDQCCRAHQSVAVRRCLGTPISEIEQQVATAVRESEMISRLVCAYAQTGTLCPWTLDRIMDLTKGGEGAG